MLTNGLEFHEYANLFPMMSADEMKALRDDMRQNGFRPSMPIMIYDGKILDGRNRYTAALAENTEPVYADYQGENALSFVISANLNRRHLDSSQRAVIALDVLPILEEEASKRHELLAGRPSKNGANICTVFEKSEIGKSRDKAAEMFNTNRQYIQDAKAIQEKAPDLLDRVKLGEMTIPQAKREMVKQERVEAAPMPSSKYRVLYADPPWSYGNSGIIGDTDNYGHVKRHYPSMTIDELCTMGDDIRGITEENAVLFMWVTSPLLEECFPVIRAWGFKYKTSFVWDKIRHNFGHYNSVRHEFLLVCVKGSCTPDISEKLDSVISLERSDKHSEKPEHFRQMIDKLYTHGKRIELFARDEFAGWETWGNEPC